MAQKKKGGFISKLLLGAEKSEGYARATMPSNRWELFWDIFKGRIGKLVMINLLVLLFCLPLLCLIFFRYVGEVSLGSLYPYGQSFGIGYGGYLSLIGLTEKITFDVNLIFYALMPIALMIASIGFAGGAYVIRNMVWTEGIFVSNDFWRGIKQNIRQMLAICFIYSLVFYFMIVSASLSDLSLANNPPNAWLFTIGKIGSYAVLVLFTIMTFHMMTMCVTYELKLRQLFRNAIMFTIGLFPQNIFFGVIGLLPFLFLFFDGILFIIGFFLVLLIAFSFFLLVWTDYCQWAYDKFVNDKVEGAKKNRGIYERVKESDSEALKQYRAQIAQKSSLSNKPIKPITDDELQVAELPTLFNRNDLFKLQESKQAIYDDHKKYVEEHMNDPEFQPTEEEKELEKERIEREKRIEKAKKELAKRNK